VVLASLAVHVAAGAIAPLTDDEAYYRLWSLKPDLGYFDHPPMIAWWIWAGRQIAGDSPFSVRLLPALATALTSLVAFDLARLAGLAERAAARAGVWLAATFLIGLGGFLAVPDAPNTLFWILSVWCAFKARQAHGAWWLAAGAAAGLACLSKYSGLFLAPGIGLCLLLDRDGRRTLITPWPWLAAIVAAAIFAPNVAWNAAHHWLTFDKQFGRVAAHHLALETPKFVVDQVGLMNPLIAVFVGLAVVRRAAWPMLAIAAPFALYLVIHSLHDVVQGQWPTPLYPLLVISAAAAAEGVRPGGWLKRLGAAAAPVGLGLSALILAFACAPLDGRLPFKDPASPLRGWSDWARRIEALRVATGARWVGAEDYFLPAQLAAQGAIRVPTVEILERQRATFETPAERADFTQPGLIVGKPDKVTQGGLARCFASVQPLGELDRGRGTSSRRYIAFRVAGPLRDIERQGC
jgi:4-amino-4-deoxy-L-arabinose transferase-like glycosyltransferase